MVMNHPVLHQRVLRVRQTIPGHGRLARTAHPRSLAVAPRVHRRLPAPLLLGLLVLLVSPQLQRRIYLRRNSGQLSDLCAFGRNFRNWTGSPLQKDALVFGHCRESCIRTSGIQKCESIPNHSSWSFRKNGRWLKLQRGVHQKRVPRVQVEPASTHWLMWVHLLVPGHCGCSPLVWCDSQAAPSRLAWSPAEVQVRS